MSQLTPYAKSPRLGLWLCLAFVAVGCGTARYAHPALSEDGEAAATLTVIREKRFAAGGARLLLRIDGEKLVRLANGECAEFQLRPGSYRISLDDPNFVNRVDLATIDLPMEAGSRSYLFLGVADVDWSVGAGANVSANTGSVGPSLGADVHVEMQMTQISAEPARELMRSCERFE